MLDTILAVAQGEIGYLEKASNKDLDDKTANAGNNNYTKYGAWYDSYYGVTGFICQPWCHMFVSWCAWKAGVTPEIVPYTASCPTGCGWFRQRGIWRERGAYLPKRGDIIYFSFGEGSVDHVGLVTEVSGNRIYTVEGNTSGGSTLIPNGGSVAAKDYSINYTGILGYGLPKYVELEGDDEKMSQDEFNGMFGTAMAEYTAERTYKNAEDVPDWGRETVDKLIAKDVLRGDTTGLNISYDMLRLLVINDRAGLYGD